MVNLETLNKIGKEIKKQKNIWDIIFNQRYYKKSYSELVKKGVLKNIETYNKDDKIIVEEL